MTDSTQADRAASYAAARRNSLVVIAASILLLVISAVVGYFFGRDLARKPLRDAQQLIAQLQPESLKMKTEMVEQSAKVASLENKLATVQTALNQIRPSDNTYNVNANQSLIVANGQLTVGLVGPPSNDYVVLNINGKQYRAATGDVFPVVPNPKTTCDVRLQSFDMFQAVVYAACKPTAQK